MALSFLFGKKKADAAPAGPTTSDTLSAIRRLQDQLDKLEKREAYVQQKIDKCMADAREKTRKKDKRGALMCLKRKKMYEQQIQNFAGAQMNLLQQINALENVSSTQETVAVMKDSASILTAAQAKVTVDDVDDVVADVTDAIDAQNEIGDAISRPIGGALEDDEDIMKEFEELNEMTMEADLMDLPSGVGMGAAAAPAPVAAVAAPSAALPSMPAVPTAVPTAPAPAATSEEDELRMLAAEMS